MGKERERGRGINDEAGGRVVDKGRSRSTVEKEGKTHKDRNFRDKGCTSQRL